MQKKPLTYTVMILFFLSIMGAGLLDYFMRIDDTDHQALGSAFAIAFVALLLHGRRIYPILLVSALLSNTLIALLLYQFSSPQWLLYSVFMTAIMFITLETAQQIIVRIKLQHYISKRHYKALGVLVLLTLFMALIISVLHSFYCYLNPFSPQAGLLCFAATFMGHLTATLVLVPVIFLFNFSREPIWFKNIARERFYESIFLVAVFVFVTALIGGLHEFMFIRHLYFTIAFFMIGALFFSSFSILGIIIILFTLYATLYYNPQWSTLVLLSEVITFYLFMITSTVVTLIFKRYLELQVEQLKHIQSSSEHLDLTLEYIERFFSLTNVILHENKDKSFYEKETFDLIKLIFPNAAHYFAYRDYYGVITPIVSTHYYANNVPLLYALHDSNLVKNQSLIIHDSLEEDFKTRYPSATFPGGQALKAKKRIKMVFRMSPNEMLIIGLDFNKNQPINIERKHQFVNLMNSLFTKQFISEQNNQYRQDIIRSFVRTLDLYDHYTKGHSEDVARISQRIALDLSDDTAFIQTVFWAGLLHDVGKLGVDDAILNKDGKLTESEYDTIKKHVNYSVQILNKSDLLKDVAQMVRDHHEQWDGSGYPRGIKEDAISLGGQIISVADAVATMATDRTYRKALSKTVIREELIKYRGKQFSPRVVDTFLPILDKELDALVKA